MINPVRSSVPTLILRIVHVTDAATSCSKQNKSFSDNIEYIRRGRWDSLFSRRNVFAVLLHGRLLSQGFQVSSLRYIQAPERPRDSVASSNLVAKGAVVLT